MREGWEYKKLGEISFYPNNRILKTEITPTNYVGVEQLLKDREGVSFEKETPSVDSAIEYVNNDILIGNIRPYLRKIWLSDRRGGASGDVVVIRISPSFIHKIQASYLFKVLSSEQFFNYDNANTKGAKMPRGDRNAIAKYPVPVPPLPEQQCIVSELDLLSSIIDKQKAQLKELDKLAQSIFYDMFGDPVENEKGWEVKTINEVCSSIVRGPFGSALKKEYFVEPTDSTYKVYEQKHAIQKDSRIGSYYITEEKYRELKRFEITAGDIIMSCSGTIGEMYVIPKGAPKGIMNQALLKFSLSNSVEKVFFLYAMDFVKQNFERKGTGLQNIGSVSTIKTTPLSVPPLPLQQLFAEKTQAIESQKASITQSIAETQMLFDYTMDKYFG